MVELAVLAPTTSLALLSLQLPQLTPLKLMYSSPSLSTSSISRPAALAVAVTLAGPLGIIIAALPPTAVKDAVLPGTRAALSGFGGGGGNARLGGGPRGATGEVGEAGETRSGISRGASWGRGGRAGELGGFGLPAPEKYAAAAGGETGGGIVISFRSEE